MNQTDLPPPPEPLPVPVLDSHTHLDIVGGDPAANIAAAAAVGVTRLVHVCVVVDSPRLGAALAAEQPARLATGPLDPHEAPRLAASRRDPALDEELQGTAG